MTDQAHEDQKAQLKTLAIFLGVPTLLIGGLIASYVWAKWLGLIGFALLAWALGSIFVNVVSGREAKSRRAESLERLEDEIGMVPARRVDNDGRIFLKAPNGTAFLWANGSILTKIPVKEVLEADVRVDSESVSKVNKGSLAAGVVGGFVLLGGVGAVAGAVAAGRREERKISSVSIQVITAKAGSITLKLYEGVALPETNPVIKAALKDAEHWRGEFIRAIKG